MSALVFWSDPTPAQFAALAAIDAAANKLKQTIMERRSAKWTDFTAMFHLDCSETKLDEHNYYRDQMNGGLHPITRTTQLYQSARTRSLICG